jgi:hypothetical protein
VLPGLIFIHAFSKNSLCSAEVEKKREEFIKIWFKCRECNKGEKVCLCSAEIRGAQRLLELKRKRETSSTTTENKRAKSVESVYDFDETDDESEAFDTNNNGEKFQ